MTACQSTPQALYKNKHIDPGDNDENEKNNFMYGNNSMHVRRHCHGRSGCR
jgi:hypothetical protein